MQKIGCRMTYDSIGSGWFCEPTNITLSFILGETTDGNHDDGNEISTTPIPIPSTTIMPISDSQEDKEDGGDNSSGFWIFEGDAIMYGFFTVVGILILFISFGCARYYVHWVRKKDDLNRELSYASS